VNETLALIEARCSTRVFAPTPVTEDEKAAILHAALRAPTGGNMQLYSIIKVEDQALKDRLAVTCDDQPMIAKAPWVLVFVADLQRWVDLFAASGVERLEDVTRRMTPGVGDLLLACSDALIAAHTAVIAAESLGIGSCYIGDILENGETHAQLLDLPPYTLPIAMLCFGRPAGERHVQPRYTEGVIHTDRYRRATPEELVALGDRLGAERTPHGFKPGIENFGQSIYERKYASDFMREMNRSAQWWLERWQTPGA
jgi:FMN reductase (NADPH)/FMN reductase [NAD(P)H]